jgi:hypothetical protein
LVVGLGAGYVEGFRFTEGKVHPSWNLGAASAFAERALAAGDYDRADDLISSARSWNPEDPGLRMLFAVAGLSSGGSDPEDVVAAASRAVPGFGVRLDAAGQLTIFGHLNEAQALTTEVIETFDDYAGWNLAGAAAVAYRLHVDLAGRIDGCEGAEEAAEQALVTPLAVAMGTENYSAQAAAFCGQ